MNASNVKQVAIGIQKITSRAEKTDMNTCEIVIETRYIIVVAS